MAVASKSKVSQRQRQNTQTKSTDQTRRSPHPNKTVSKLPIARQPLWLLHLRLWQRRSHIMTLILVALAISLYGWTANSQKNQYEAAKQLTTLRQREQKLTIANEELKHDLAQQAEQNNSDLEPVVPEKTLFLQPSPVSAEQKASPAAPNSMQKPQPRPNPLGY